MRAYLAGQQVVRAFTDSMVREWANPNAAQFTLVATYTEFTEAGNAKLVQALLQRPGKFYYDGANFIEDLGGGQTKIWTVDTSVTVTRSAFGARNTTALKAQAAAATSVPALRAVVTELVQAVEELQVLLME